MEINRLATVIAIAVAMVQPAFAAPQNSRQSPREFQDVVTCLSISDDAKRLACYDAKVAALKRAEENNDLVVADKEQVREAKRGLFGFSLPEIHLFGDGDEEDKGNEFTELETTITSARRQAGGHWRFTLKTGAVWEQAETRTLAYEPDSGSSIRIREAALGSYLANIDGHRAVRVKRVQ